MPIHFYNPAALVWLLLVPVLAGLFIYAARKRRLAVAAFGAGAALRGRKREAFGGCIAVALTVLALTRPAWDVEEQKLQETGRDVIFLLDVSRSMLAEDLFPNRLENAKTAILDCVEILYGDRVGLVLFAGAAEIHCPLTLDYDYFRMALRQASPESVALGGTMIANAIEKVVDKLADPEKQGLLDLILITDGDDLVSGTDEIEAARLLKDSGTRLIAIGIGDRTKGSRIVQVNEETGTRSFVKHGQAEVWTRLQSETLRDMAAAVPGGTYFEVADGPFDLKRIYRQVMEHASRSPIDSDVMERYKEKFHLFLAGAVLSLLLSHRWRAARVQAVLLLLLLSATAQAGPGQAFREGNRAYAKGRFEEAVQAFQQAAAAEPDSAEIYYNLGNALYRADHLEEAAESFAYAASVAGSGSFQSRCWYNQGNCMVRTAAALRPADTQAALYFGQQAAEYYRMALELQPDFADAAHNLEMSLRLNVLLEEAVVQEQEKEKQDNELFKMIREKLQELIERQTPLVTAPDAALQQQIERDTRALLTLMEASGLHLPIPMPDGTPIPGPLEETYAHTVNAADAMAVPDAPTALAELIAALGSAPEDPESNPDEGDDSDEPPDDSDMDYEPSDEEGEISESADPFGDFSEYEEIRGMPPPAQSEMDILAEEIENQSRRKAKQAGEYKKIDKDW